MLRPDCTNTSCTGASRRLVVSFGCVHANNEDKARRRLTAPFIAALPAALLLVHCSLNLTFSNVSAGGDSGLGPDGSILPTDDGSVAPDSNAPDASTTSCKGTPGRGPTMVAVVLPNVPAFCIDTTEVSISQYKSFLDDPNKPTAPAPCKGTDRAPKNGNYLFNLPDLTEPIRYVDWCDAATFCAWAGKRLCGKPGGGPSDFNDHEDVNVSQWYAGCTQKEEDYPYGNTHVDGKCNVDFTDNGECEVAPTKFPGCHGAISQLLGMTGNVKEWEDSCDGDDCRVRGGSCFHKHDQATCGTDEKHKREGQNNLSDVGFRCCSSP